MNASSYILGEVLSHELDGVPCPIAYANRTMTPAEPNYLVAEEECLVIVFPLKKFDTYFNGTTYTFQTVHQALPWLKNKRILQDIWHGGRFR